MNGGKVSVGRIVNNSSGGRTFRVDGDDTVVLCELKKFIVNYMILKDISYVVLYSEDEENIRGV